MKFIKSNGSRVKASGLARPRPSGPRRQGVSADRVMDVSCRVKAR